MEETTPPAPAASTEVPATKVVEASKGVILFGIPWMFLTPLLAMYAVTYPDGNGLVGLLVLVGTMAAIFVFLHPKGPLFIANKAAGLAARIGLSAALVVLLVVKDLPVWAVIYGLISVGGIVAGARFTAKLRAEAEADAGAATS